MSSKISALPAAASFDNSDVLDGLAGGVNSQIDRATFLADVLAEGLEISSGLTTVQLDNTGGVVINSNGAPNIQFELAAQTKLQINGSGIQLTETGATIQLAGALGAFITMDPAGNITVSVNAPATLFLTYNPGNPAAWLALAPTDIAIAVNRLANAVFGLLGAPIP